MTHSNGTSTDVVFFQGAGPTLFQQPDAEVQMPPSPVPNPHSQVLALAQGEWSLCILWVLLAINTEQPIQRLLALRRAIVELYSFVAMV